MKKFKAVAATCDGFFIFKEAQRQQVLSMPNSYV